MLHGNLKELLNKHIGNMTSCYMLRETTNDTALYEIDEVKINTDNAYKLDMAIKVKDIHKTILNGESISRVIAAILKDNVKFTKLEISGLEKLNIILSNGNNIYFGTKPQGYDLAVNTTMISALTRSIKEQRNIGFDTMVLETYKGKFESGSIRSEEHNMLINSGLHTYINAIKLAVEILGNVLVRANNSKY
jgi:hypothetical protein